jgi:hypothetical protein
MRMYRKRTAAVATGLALVLATAATRPAGLHRRGLRADRQPGHSRRRGPLRQRRGLVVRDDGPAAGHRSKPGQLQERHGPHHLHQQLTGLAEGVSRPPPAGRIPRATTRPGLMPPIYDTPTSRATTLIVAALVALTLALAGGTFLTVQSNRPAMPTPVIGPRRRASPGRPRRPSPSPTRWRTSASSARSTAPGSPSART